MLGRLVVVLSPLLVLLLGGRADAQLPPPPVPFENPVTPTKAVLGKILFYEEQVSSDNTMACATCHAFEAGGSDPRNAAHPGSDGIFNTADDTVGSPGVVLSDAQAAYRPHSAFGFQPQVTSRYSPSFLTAAYFNELFWDGRASSRFLDPQTGTVSILNRGALESQSVGPPLSDAEMAHENRDWTQIIAKLQTAAPLRLASNLPNDVAQSIAANPGYPGLFQAAFGDPQITAERIAFAIATYERTIIPNQTPWDAFVQGNQNALNQSQRRGLQLFDGRANCRRCHGGPLFSDGQFHNIGLRPLQEDLGRFGVTGNNQDRGRFKTPSLRNVAAKDAFFHTGTAQTLREVVEFYNRGGDFRQNQDPQIDPLGLSPQQINDLVNFLQNGLTDSRVAAGTPPFDRPTLYSESGVDNPTLFGPQAHPGAGGFSPEPIATSPPNLSNADFKLGVHGALGGSPALLAVSAHAGLPGQEFRGIPVNLALTPPPIFYSRTLSGSGAGQGYGTVIQPIPNLPQLTGQAVFAQWFVADAAAVGGFSATRGIRLDLF